MDNPVAPPYTNPLSGIPGEPPHGVGAARQRSDSSRAVDADTVSTSPRSWSLRRRRPRRCRAHRRCRRWVCDRSAGRPVCGGHDRRIAGRCSGRQRVDRLDQRSRRRGSSLGGVRPSGGHPDQPARPDVAGPGRGDRVRAVGRRLHRHQQPRDRRGRQPGRHVRRRHHRAGHDRRRRPEPRPRRAQGRPHRPRPAGRRRLRRPAPRRPVDRRRLCPRPQRRAVGDRPASCRPRTARSSRRTASSSSTCCRPTRRSTPATPAARC